MQKFDAVLNEQFTDKTDAEMVFVLRETFDGVIFSLEDITVAEETEEGTVLDFNYTILAAPEDLDQESPELRDAISAVISEMLYAAVGGDEVEISEVDGEEISIDE
jgi:hypothetical protein